MSQRPGDIPATGRAEPLLLARVWAGPWRRNSRALHPPSSQTGDLQEKTEDRDGDFNTKTSSFSYMKTACAKIIKQQKMFPERAGFQRLSNRHSLHTGDPARWLWPPSPPTEQETGPLTLSRGLAWASVLNRRVTGLLQRQLWSPDPPRAGGPHAATWRLVLPANLFPVLYLFTYFCLMVTSSLLKLL